MSSETWLVATGHDGAYSKIVVGFEAMKEAVVRCIWPDGDDAGDADAIRARLSDPDEWETTSSFDHWFIRFEFEDGYIRVQRVIEYTPDPELDEELKVTKEFLAVADMIERIDQALSDVPVGVKEPHLHGFYKLVDDTLRFTPVNNLPRGQYWKVVDDMVAALKAIAVPAALNPAPAGDGWNRDMDAAKKESWVEVYIPDRMKFFPRVAVVKWGRSIVGAEGWFTESGERVSGTPDKWRPLPPAPTGGE